MTTINKRDFEKVYEEKEFCIKCSKCYRIIFISQDNKTNYDLNKILCFKCKSTD